ncbi:MAG: penicillin-binding protein 1A [Pseudomonadota bacterium]
MVEKNLEEQTDSVSDENTSELQKTSVKKSGNLLHKLFKAAFFIVFSVFIISIIIVTLVIQHLSSDLPDHNQLAQYKPLTVSRLYSYDGKIIAEYAEEKRLFVPIQAMPKLLKNAFIAAEDKNFYNHSGVDFISIFRALITNINNYGKNRPLVGGSTITQQVVKNFLLTNEKSLERKVKEAILAFRISSIFSKDQILELYLNEIYLGARSYGVAAASLNYFNKSIDELEIEEAALLAGLPKAPSTYNPKRNPEKALVRRNYVLDRMLEEKFITKEQYIAANSLPIKLTPRDRIQVTEAEYFAETVRRQIIHKYGKDKLYKNGLSVFTTLNPTFQTYATKALQDGITKYDRRHGYRGPITKLSEIQKDDNLPNKNEFADSIMSSWQEKLQNVSYANLHSGWNLAIVLYIDDTSALIGLKDGNYGTIPLSNLKWAREYIDENTVGQRINFVSDVLNIGDVILVSYDENKQEYWLEQQPEVNGAILVMDPHNGRILAMVGGYDNSSTFNRAIQANRQPGSAFKPFIYLSALGKDDFTPASIIVDAEIEFKMEDGNIWSPKNYSNRYYGPSTLRQGVERSRNAMTVRLSQIIGLNRVTNLAKKLGLYDKTINNYSFVLGSQETNVLKLVNSYASLVNGGKKVNPTLVEYIKDSNGKVIYKRDNRLCRNCNTQIKNNNEIYYKAVAQEIPLMQDNRKQIIDELSAYQMVSILEGVIERGTGRKARSVNKTLGGKTGTTNNSVDSWFIGFSPDLVVGVYVGFDRPKSLGKKETGASVALPIFIDFMKKALEDKQDIPFRVPKDIRLVKIDRNTGVPPNSGTSSSNIITEAFKPSDIVTLQVKQDSNISNDIGKSGIY